MKNDAWQAPHSAAPAFNDQREKGLSMRVFGRNGEAGGAALEYIVVSVFGLLLAVASIAIVGQATREKLASIEQKLGIQLNLDELNPFN